MNIKSNKAFTLAEVVIAIGCIVGILIVVAIGISVAITVIHFIAKAW